MEVIRFDQISECQESLRAIALGTFDSIHLGHQNVLKKTLELGRGNAGIVTFLQNPGKVFHEEEYLGDVLALEQKLTLFAKMGFKRVILIDFSLDFSKIRGETFLNEIMKIQGLKWVVVGSDYRCGFQGEMDTIKIKGLLSHCNIAVFIVSLKKRGFHKISSSIIRKLILKGKIKKVKQFIGREFEIVLPSFVSGDSNEFLFSRSAFVQTIPETGLYQAVQQDGVEGVISFTKETVRLYGFNGAVKNRITLTNILRR